MIGVGEILSPARVVTQSTAFLLECPRVTDLVTLVVNSYRDSGKAWFDRLDLTAIARTMIPWNRD